MHSIHDKLALKYTVKEILPQEEVFVELQKPGFRQLCLVMRFSL